MTACNDPDPESPVGIAMAVVNAFLPEAAIPKVFTAVDILLDVGGEIPM
jgi:hypothetical protein